MHTILFLLGLTIIYYIVLFRLDQRKRAAFKIMQQQAIGKTAALPVLPIAEPNLVFGTTPDFDTEQEEDMDALTQTLVSKDDNDLQGNLEEMMLDLEAEQTFETPENKLFGELNAIMEDEDISNIVATISQRKI